MLRHAQLGKEFARCRAVALYISMKKSSLSSLLDKEGFSRKCAWLVTFTQSSQIISTHLLTVLTKRCNVILQIEQEQKGGCLYEYK